MKAHIILLLLSLALLVTTGTATHSDDAFGGLDLAKVAGSAAGISGLTEGFAQLQQKLEVAFPVGMSRGDTHGRLAEASKQIDVPSGFRISTAFYDSVTYLIADRAIGTGVARLTIRFKFDRQNRLGPVLSVLSFETSRDNCIWPEGTGGPSPTQNGPR